MALTRISGPENWQNDTIIAKKHNGVVTIRLWGTASGTYTIPPEYRPEITQVFSYVRYSNEGQISVTAAGTLTVEAMTGTGAYATFTYLT